MKNHVRAIILSGIWMNISEFVRNEWVLQDLWQEGFGAIGLSFPSAPVNGAIWGLWTFLFVSLLSLVCTRFTVLQSILISWCYGFVLLWLAMWNMAVLPVGILWLAVPWSLAEVSVAAYICQKILQSDSE